MTDTLFVTIIDTVYVSPSGWVNDTIVHLTTDQELLNQVRDFYDSSWNKLIWVISIAFGLIAIAIPIVIAYIQRIQLRANEKKIVQETKELVLKEISEELERKHNYFKGALFHMQGNMSKYEKIYHAALGSFLVALLHYMKAECIEDAKRICDPCLKSVQGNIDESTLKGVFNEYLEKTIEDYFKELKDLEFSKYMKGEIKQLEKDLKNIKDKSKRDPLTETKKL